MSKMKKVIIIGCPGAGKSTFARKLAAKTGLPLHYLDMIWHKPDRTTVSREEFDTRLEEILANDEWIIDGNYQRTMLRRLDECDTVFFFDIPLDICLSGAIERLGQVREDMPWQDEELDEDFRQWILNFPNYQLPVIEFLLGTCYSGNIVRFSSREEADDYIAQMP